MANSSNWLIYLRISEGRQLGYRILRRKSKFEGRRWEETKVFRVTEKGKRNERGVLFLPNREGRNACQIHADPYGIGRSRSNLETQPRSTGVRIL